MEFLTPLLHGTLTARYKRFFADVTLEDSTPIVAHCPNTGPMLEVLHIPQKAWITQHNNPKRKLQYTLEILEHNDVLIGCNTHRTNHIAKELLLSPLSPLSSTTINAEVSLHKHTRIDFVLDIDSNNPVFVEVKNVSYREGTKALFPDTVSLRAQKHVQELIELQQSGKQAVLLYIIQRGDVTSCSPASHLDPVYADLCKKAAEAGVQFYAYTCAVTPLSITANKQVPVIL